MGSHVCVLLAGQQQNGRHQPVDDEVANNCHQNIGPIDHQTDQLGHLDVSSTHSAAEREGRYQQNDELDAATEQAVGKPWFRREDIDERGYHHCRVGDTTEY